MRRCSPPPEIQVDRDDRRIIAQARQGRSIGVDRHCGDQREASTQYMTIRGNAPDQPIDGGGDVPSAQLGVVADRWGAQVRIAQHHHGTDMAMQSGCIERILRQLAGISRSDCSKQ